MITLQEYADEIVTAEFKQSLKTIEEAMAVHGWTFTDEDPDKGSRCCGEPISTQSFLGGIYHAECKSCGKFIHDVTGPQFATNGVGACYLVDREQVDTDSEPLRRWIAGTQQNPDLLEGASDE